MSQLESVAYAPARVSHRRYKKTNKRLNLTLDELNDFARQHNLSEWQKELIRKVDIERQNFSHIARCCGLTRQRVSFAYNSIYNKAVNPS